MDWLEKTIVHNTRCQPWSLISMPFVGATSFILVDCDFLAQIRKFFRGPLFEKCVRGSRVNSFFEELIFSGKVD